MGIFKGRRKRGLFLTSKKKKKYVIQFCSPTGIGPLKTSTPWKSSSEKRKRTPRKISPHKRAKFISPIKRCIIKLKSPSKQANTVAKPFNKKSRKTLKYEDVSNDSSNNNEYEELSENAYDLEDCETVLYSFESQGDSTVNYGDNTTDSFVFKEESEEDSIVDVFKDVLQILEKENMKEEFMSFLKLVSAGKFPLDNVALMLFIDVIKWFNASDVRQVRYNDTSLKFFWLGKKLFGGRFIRFMSGPKNEADMISGKTALRPMDSKVNFACPSESILSNYNPLGYELEAENGPGILQSMIDLTASKSTSGVSYVLMFDGKKIKRGADVDLLGFEDEPIAGKRDALENDLKVIDETLNTLQLFNHNIEMARESDQNMKDELTVKVQLCFSVISKFLREMRILRQSKAVAMRKYKERIEKDPSLAKTLQYAMDACRTSSYQTENCISVFLDVQWEICKCSAFLHGALSLFAKSKKVNIENQGNVKLLKPVTDMMSELDTDNLPTSLIKQRSPEWHSARENVKVTGSSIYTAVGCDGLKKQNEQFDSVFSNIEKPRPNEAQAKAMQHGVDSETNQIATLAGVVLPAFFPYMTYWEEGYYLEDRVIVSPDGSIRDNSTSSVIYAFEGKAPVERQFTTRQQYKVPERYITQTLYEQKVTRAEKGTLYMCWTPESSTVFIVPKSEEICSQIQHVIEDLYLRDIPKRRTRISNESKQLKQNLKDHVSKCIFVGEFPSVEAEQNTNTEKPATVADDSNKDYEYSDLSKSLLKAKSSMKSAYNIQRKYASQVVVYLLADLDRLWKSELPHAVPVMYCYRGYSLSMDVARNLLEHCRKACTDQGLDVIATSSDGEFIQLMVKGQDGRPLTLCQLSKSVWNEVCKIKKSDLVKCLRSLNKKHISIEEGGHVSLISVDGGCNITTPRKGWKKKSKTGKHTENNIMIDIEETDNMNENVLSDDHMKEIEGQKASIVNEVDNLFDDTIEYDIEELLEIENQYTKAGTFPRRLENDELKIILQMLNQRRPKKWNSVSVEKLSEIMETNMNVLTKEELLDVAKYLNITLKGTGKEVAVTKVKKSDLVEQLGKILKSTTKTQTTQRKKTTKNPKRLQDIAAGILIKASYPKQVLNIAYAEYIWPERVKLWKEKNRVAQTIMVKTETEEMNFEPYYVPEFDENSGVFRIFTYDKTHLGTNLRKCMCLDKVRGISIQAWKHVSKARPDILHPSLVEVDDDGRILDQMKESLARSMVSKEVEQEMLEHGFGNEAEFCSVIREGLYVADDVPGISALDRCRKRISLMQWLDKGVDFSQFPPYGGSIKGLSHILYEGLRLSQEAKMYLYALAKSGTYCVRAPNTLCSESFFGTMQEMDPWGQGILSSSGVQKHISDFTTITAMKMDEKRHVYMKTKKDAVYPLPKVVSSQELYTNEEEQKEQEPDEIVQHSGIECHCRQERFIQCIVPRDHFFDSAARARLYKGEKTYKSSVNSGVLRGEQPIRSQYSYKINEARMLPSKRLGIEDKVYQ